MRVSPPNWAAMPAAVRLGLLSLLLLVVLTTAVACGGGSEASTVPFIDQDGLKFRPGKVTIPAGTTVTFKNSETALHTINVNGENESGTMKKDELFERAFVSPGSYRITCDFHPQMKATVEVR